MLPQPDEDDLADEAIVQALREFTPKFGRDFLVDVQSHDDFRGIELLEGMLDAIGDVGCYAHLGLHPHISRAGHFHQVVEQATPAFQVLLPVVVVIHDVECHQPPTEFGITHHNGDIE